MNDFSPTLEQQAIISAGTETKDNLLISALAGAAKTSTLVLLAEALPRTPILSLAFNKKIAVEMSSRLPSNCESSTLNSLGHRAWSQYLGKRLTVDSKKTYRIVRDLIEKLPQGDRSEAFEVMSDIMRAVDSGKTCGYIPSDKYKMAKRLMDDSEFFAWLDEEPSPLMESLIRKATLISIQEALSGLIDFGDQLLLPTCWPANFPFFSLVLIDEAQDLSALNHFMLRKIAKKRIIAVGDPCQAIYGFRGAHEDSMSLLRQQFSMVELPLTISFRCPQAVVEEARWRAPAMQYPDWAKEGSVTRLTEWGVEDIPPGDTAIICRNNAPLFSLALRMLRDGRYPEIVGNELGKSLIKILNKLGPNNTPQEEVFQLIADWEAEKLSKTRSPERVTDTAACLRIFAEAGATLGRAVEYAERIMSVTGPTKLMTGHKSKGLEFENVFILDRQLLDLKKGSQDRNLLYVMQTRAKQHLTYVRSEDYTSGEEE